MYKSVTIEPLSKSQHSRLQCGHSVRVKLSKSGNTRIRVSQIQLKKLLKAEKNGSKYTITFDPFQQSEHKAMRGSGVKKQFTRLDVSDRAIATLEGELPVGSMDGEGFRDIKWKKLGKRIVKVAKKVYSVPIVKRVADALIERGIKTIAGGGRPKVKSVKRKRKARCGGALYPAGYRGGALFPA